MKKLIRTTTVPESLRVLLKGQLKYMSASYDVIAITSKGEDYSKMLKEQGVRGYTVPFTRKTFSPLCDFLAFIKLIYIFVKEKPYIVHSHTSKDGLLCMIVAWICRVPNRLYTIAGIADISGIRGKVLNIAESIIFRCATNVYPNSHRMNDTYVANKLLKVSKAKVLLNGSSNGIDTSFFDGNNIERSVVERIRKDNYIDKSSFVFLFVGRIVGDKGINELVSAFSKLSFNNDNVKLMIVGRFEKDLDPLKRKTIEEINNNKNIILVGYQTDVRPFILASDTLVHPSYREGMPNIVMQAGALGKASIVSDINGCNEIIIDGVNGSIIPRKDSDSLYEKMKYYLNNINEVKEMESNARDLVISRYNQLDMWKAILNEYNSFK